MVNDVSRAYFYAPSLKPTFVQICAEDFEPGDEHRYGKLLASMYGTRPAAGKLAEMLHRRSQGKRIHHISIFDVYLLSHHSKNYGIRAQ